MSNKVVGKILRSLPWKYEAIVAAIEVSKDINVLTIDELFASLQSHEDPYKSYDEAPMEKAFQTKLNLSKENDSPSNMSSNRGGLSFRGRRGGRGQKGGARGHDQNRSHNAVNNGETHIRKVRCYYCNKSGHIEVL